MIQNHPLVVFTSVVFTLAFVWFCLSANKRSREPRKQKPLFHCDAHGTHHRVAYIKLRESNTGPICMDCMTAHIRDTFTIMCPPHELKQEPKETDDDSTV